MQGVLAGCLGDGGGRSGRGRVAFGDHRLRPVKPHPGRAIVAGPRRGPAPPRSGALVLTQWRSPAPPVMGDCPHKRAH
ncbi:uncharacterized protein J3R85_003515 [Psidium guajava]|nr:uncharacterized protein J3R85_003515 [Psidium guajava]